MLKHIASKHWQVQASVSSKNEPRQSLPYLTGIDDKTQAAIFELGLGNTGNIKHQCMIYQPTIGIITNIGVHHLDGCLNLEGYIKAKAEIVEGIKVLLFDQLLYLIRKLLYVAQSISYMERS